MMVYTIPQSITTFKDGYAKELYIAEPSKLANPKLDHVYVNLPIIY